HKVFFIHGTYSQQSINRQGNCNVWLFTLYNNGTVYHLDSTRIICGKVWQTFIMERRNSLAFLLAEHKNKTSLRTALAVFFCFFSFFFQFISEDKDLRLFYGIEF